MLAMVFGHLFIQLVTVVLMIVFPLNAVCMLVEATCFPLQHSVVDMYYEV